MVIFAFLEVIRTKGGIIDMALMMAIWPLVHQGVGHLAKCPSVAFTIHENLSFYPYIKKTIHFISKFVKNYSLYSNV